ncbi:MAG: hypothetical protein EU544_01920 [Promethearchaeota archaeon]|nr:MAG: hypothetical protein EU544_01920 [Candidatus Lokiarchaeota archaeon]
MSNEKEFHVNEYLTVRLEKPFDPQFKRLQTSIYVGGRFFRQCKFLLLNIREYQLYVQEFWTSFAVI